MLTFSPKWTEPILDGKKDVTLRKWPNARVKVGGVYDVATVGYPPKKFARVEVTGLRRIKLGEIDDATAKRDGATVEDVQAYWKKQGFGLDKELWLIEFRLKVG
ncbi:MAG: ASCH domain-containing protein [Thaumarchaeota archaeon]|nr:ASCH domain-containing protein [Nitrososphaerota archaeon]